MSAFDIVKSALEGDTAELNKHFENEMKLRIRDSLENMSQSEEEFDFDDEVDLDP